jgi:microcystin-dependent protein
LLPISQNTALFSLLGTNFGGDGKSNFALPNLQGNTPLFWQQGPGLSDYFLGEQGGGQTVTLLQSELPSHNHSANATTNAGTANDPNGNLLSEGAWNDGQGGSGKVAYYSTAAANTQMSPNAVSITGGGLPHNNMMPYLTLNFCIALQGVFPPRT